MLICKGDKSYKCNITKSFTEDATYYMWFDITEPICHADVAELFEDNDFYFCDESTQCRLLNTYNTKLVGLHIKYNADSTCKIIIYLLKGVVKR